MATLASALGLRRRLDAHSHERLKPRALTAPR